MRAEGQLAPHPGRRSCAENHGLRASGRPIVVSEGDTSIEQILQRDGTLALPHYIHRTLGLRTSTTTRRCMPHSRAIAAPTAACTSRRGFQALADAGIRTAKVTLHIGPGTFAPVRASRSRVTPWNPSGTRFRRDADCVDLRAESADESSRSAPARPCARVVGDHRDVRDSPGSLFIRAFASSWQTRC